MMEAITAKLASLGISAAVKAGEKMLKGVLPTEWDRKVHPGLIFHIPSNQIPFIKLLIVKEYESGVFLRDGKLYAVLPPGRWFIGRMPIVGRMEFIWVDIGIKKIRFGLRTLTSDGVELGANGVTYLRVTDAERFIINLATAKELYSAEELEDFLRDQINSIMRAEMANYDVQSLYIERDMFISVARVKLQEMFFDLGLEFRTLEISGILLPDEVRDTLRKPMMAVREAQAMIATGTATAEILGKIKSAGVDPVKFKAAEALMKYSERPGGAGAPLSGDFLMPMVFFGMLMKDDSITGDIKEQLKRMFPQFIEKEESKQIQESPIIETKEKPEYITTYTKKRIQELLDGLDMRLALGEITEETYNRLKEKWESRMK